MESTLELVVSGLSFGGFDLAFWLAFLEVNLSSQFDSVVSVSMIMLMALDRYGAIKSYKYMQVNDTHHKRDHPG